MSSSTRVPLSGEVEVRVEAADGAVDVRLYRRESIAPGAGWRATNAGLRLPAHLAEIVAEAIRTAA